MNNMPNTTGQSGGSHTAIDWQDFFTEANVPMIGYDIQTDAIIVFKGADYSEAGRGNILHFDVKTGAWTEGESRLSNSADLSNPIINSDGELAFTTANGTGDFLAWDSAPKASTDFEVISKAFDMGAPAIKKRLYKVILEYTGTTAANIKLYVQWDQSGTWIEISTLTNTSGGVYTVLELSIPVAQRVDFRDVTIKLAAYANVSSVFELSGYSLLYRTKNPR